MTTTVTGSPDEPLCERCEKEPVSKDCEEGLYCENCLQNLAENAYESFLENYYGGGEPVTLEEQYQEASREKYGLK